MKRFTWRVTVRIWTVRGDAARMVYEKHYHVKAQKGMTAGARAVRSLQRSYRKRLTPHTSVYFTASKVAR